MRVGGWWGFGGSWRGLSSSVPDLLASAGLMAMRLYKVYDVVMTSHGFVVIQTLSVTVDHQSCYKFTIVVLM